jgi:hypothetical protein
MKHVRRKPWTVEDLQEFLGDRGRVISNSKGRVETTKNCGVCGTNRAVPSWGECAVKRWFERQLGRSLEEDEMQVVFDDCRHKRLLRFDFLVADVLVEVNGSQHYAPKFSVTSDEFENAQKRDSIKRAYAEKYGIPFVVVKTNLKGKQLTVFLDENVRPLMDVDPIFEMAAKHGQDIGNVGR